MSLTLATLLALALPSEPLAFGVLGAPEGQHSELVVFDGDAPRHLAAFVHAAGWLPRTAVDLARGVAYAAVVAPGASHGATAALVVVDLASGEQRVIEPRVPPRQPVVLAGDRVVYVRHLGVAAEPSGRRMALERFALVTLRAGEAKVLLEHAGYLLWPLFTAGDEVIVLRIAPGEADLIAVGLARGASRVVRAFGAAAVRDFSRAGDAVVYQRALPDGRSAVERAPLRGGSAGEGLLLADAEPWLAPLATGRGVLVSRAESAVAGRLVLLAPEPREVELPWRGAAIPLAALGDHALVHVQAKGGHRYARVDLAKGVARPLDTRGMLLESAQLLEAK